MGDTVLVTGAAGFIGSSLVDRLLARGDGVIGVDNFDPYYPRVQKERNLEAAGWHPAFRLVEADCADLEALDAAVPPGRIDAVVHLAARAGVRPSLEDPVGYAVANVVGTQAVLEFMRRRGVARLVFASSSSVYGNNDRVPFNEEHPVLDPISPYAATKRAGELLCRTHQLLHGTSTVALRLFTVYGPRQRPDLAIRKFATALLAGRPVTLYGDGTSERDYTWIGDIVTGMQAAMDYTARTPAAFEIINLGGNRTTPLRRLVSLIADAAGVPERVVRSAHQPGDVSRTFADVAKAGYLLGYRPRVGIEEGIARFIEWLSQEERPAGPTARAPVAGGLTHALQG